MNATTNERPGRPRASLVAVLALFATVLALGLAALAQDGDQATAPGRNSFHLYVEVTEDGVVLHWEAPASDADTITGYEIQGRHLQQEVGILRILTGNTSSRRITFTDRTATDPGLLYLYRVRALRDDQGSPWSDYVVIEDGQPVEPSAALLELVPTEVVAVAPLEPTAAVEFEPTSVGPVTPAAPLTDPGQAEEEPVDVQQPVAEVPAAPVEPTAVLPEPEPTAAAPVALAPPAPLPESSNELNVSQPVVVIEPEIEPEVELISEQQQAEEEPAAPVAPTAVPPEPEPTTAAPVAPVKIQEPEQEPEVELVSEQQQAIETVPELVVTEEEPAPPPAPTAVPPEPEPTTAAPVAPVKIQEPEQEPEVELVSEQQQAIETVPELVVTEEEPAPPSAPTSRPASEPEPTASA
jgi:hypothetical protein